MNITPEKLRTLWYEDKNGFFVGAPDFNANIEEESRRLMTNAKYQVSRFPLELKTTYLRLEEDGTSTEVAVESASYSEEFVLALVNSREYSLHDAILIAGISCERCASALRHELRYYLPEDADWGYAEGSEEWQRSRTSCTFCYNEEAQV